MGFCGMLIALGTKLISSSSRSDIILRFFRFNQNHCSFLDFESPHPLHQAHFDLPFFLISLSFLVVFWSCLLVVAFTFRIHGDAFRLVPQNCDFRLLFTFQFQPPHLFSFPSCHRSPRSFRRGLLHVLHLPRKLRLHFFHITCHTAQQTFCLECLTHSSSLSTLPTFAAFSLCPFHFDIVPKCGFICARNKASLDFFSSTSLSSSKIVSQYFSLTSLCNLILSSTRPARTSCLSLKSFTSCIISGQRLSSSTNPFGCVSHLSALAMYTSVSPCLKVSKSFWPLSFLACLGNLRNRFLRRFQLFFQLTGAHFWIFTVFSVFQHSFLLAASSSKATHHFR